MSTALIPWIVMDPTEVSELADCLYHPEALVTFRDWCTGASIRDPHHWHRRHVTFYLSEDEARTDALARMKAAGL